MKPGDTVCCVNAKGSSGLLREGQHYTIDRMGPPGFVYVVGVEPWRPGFYVERFRKAPSIAVFEAMLVREPCDLQSAN